MGRINNGNWVSQYRKIQGKFQNKQDIEAYLFNKKLNNGNNTQGNNTLNTDDLPNIPAVLDYELNLLRQNSIEPIDGGKAHTPTTQVFLTAFTALSVISPNITVSSKKDISTDNQNSLSSTVKSFTEMSKTPVLFDTTSATTPTSQNHDKSKEPTKHNDNQSLIRVKRAESGGYIIFDDNKLTVLKVPLDTEIIKQKLKENSNITELHLVSVWGVDSQKAQEIGTILKNSNISTISFNKIYITWIKELVAALKDTNVIVLKLQTSAINSEDAKEIVENLKGTKVKELILAHSCIGDKGAIDLIKSLKEGGTKVKVLNLVGNDISNKGAEYLVSELTDTQIIEVDLMGNNNIEPRTLQKISKVLEHNRHVNKESYTSTMESSTTEEESSKDLSGKQEKHDIHTINKPLPKEKSTASTPEEFSTTTIRVTTSSADNPTTSATVWSNPQKTTTPKKNLTEKSEPIAEDIVADFTTPTPKESNPNNPASSTMSIGETVGLIAFAVTTIGTIGSTVGCVIKKFCGGKSHFVHDALALAEPNSGSHLDNNKDIFLTGVLVNNDADI
jgi:hypothetical protein